MRLFGRGGSASSGLLAVHLNARLQPMHRGELFEDPLDELLRKGGVPASVEGGGTELSPDGEPLSCDVELILRDPSEATTAAVIAQLVQLGAPKGSRATGPDGVEHAFGKHEGVGLYLNGTELPDEVYATSDVNELIRQLEEALRGTGGLFSHWEGPRETALYLYGESSDLISERIQQVCLRHPLAQRSRVVKIA